MHNTELIVSIPSLKAVGTIKGKSTLSIQSGKEQPGTDPKQPVERQIIGATVYEPWGLDNMLPYQYELRIQENTALGGAIQTKVDNLYAGGVEYGYLDAKSNFEKIYDPEIETFLEQPQVIQYLGEAWLNYVKFQAIFPKIVFNATKSKVLHFRHISAPEMRWERQNETSGIIEAVYWSKKWQFGTRDLEKEAIKYQVIDEMFHTVDQVREDQDHYEAIYKAQIPGTNTYYQIPIWYSSVVQGWHKHSMQVPEWYRVLMDNVTTMQYEVIFEEDYFLKIYGDAWLEAGPETKKSYMSERLEVINKQIKGTENAGKSVSHLRWYDSTRGDIVQGFEIKKIEINTFSGEYLNNLREADQHIMWVVGVDPVSMGAHGQGGLGSGSEKKAAQNSEMSTNERHASIILAPFYFAKRFNNWPANLKFRTKTPYLGDLNQVTPSQREGQFSDTKPKKSDGNNKQGN